MAWYNPINWFGELPESDILCDYSLCKRPITSDAAYVPEERVIYHDDCLKNGLVELCYNSSRVIVANPKRISSRKALRLYHKGNLAQTSSLSEEP